jgi:hypothetical protein
VGPKLKDSDYGGIYDYYSRYGESGMQHEQMADYRISIVNMLKEFQPGLSQGEALAWEGLIGTVAWDALVKPNKNLCSKFVDFNNNGGEDCN